MEEDRPLGGLHVLDFSWVIAGPLATKFLADLGAEVVKVEHPSKLDTMRIYVPYKDGVPGINRAGAWSVMNAGKQSIALNLRTQKGRELIRHLAIWADVLVENFTAGRMAEWGLDYGTLAKDNPRLVMVSASSMGQFGSDAKRPGMGFHFAAYAGFTSLTGWRDREPLGAIAYTDYISPGFIVASVLGALDYRHRTGKGQYIDLSQSEVALQFIAPAILEYSGLGKLGERTGNRDPDFAPHGAYRCKGKDQWCAIAVQSDEQWKTLCMVMEKHELATDPRFATLPARKNHEDYLHSIVEAWTRQREAGQVESTLLKAGIPAGIVANGKDLFQDPRLRDREYFMNLPHCEGGTMVGRRSMARFSDLDSRPRGGAPAMGQDTQRVLTTILGLSTSDVAELIAEGVLQGAAPVA